MANCGVKLLLNWNCRRENLALLIPLIITVTEDEDEEVAQKTQEIWSQIGSKYLDEEAKNDKRVKDRKDFPLPQPNHYPKEKQRPNLGCRLMVCKVFHQFGEALQRDLKDWLPETRVKTSQLLQILVLHLEEDAISHAEKILRTIREGLLDSSEQKVVSNCLRAAFYLGHFVPPKTWIYLVYDRLKQENLQILELKIMNEIIAGSDSEFLKAHKVELAEILQSEICLKQDVNLLHESLKASKMIVEKCSAENCQEIEEHLFKIGITVIALSESEEMKESAREFLLSLHDNKNVYRRQMGGFLRHFRSDCSDWSASNDNARIFSTLVVESGSTSGVYAFPILEVLKKTLDCAENKPEMQLKMLLTLSKQLYNGDQGLNSKGDLIDNYGQMVVKDIILPRLKWLPGKKALAVRIAALTGLFSGLTSKAIKLEKSAKEILPALNALIEDGDDRVRSLCLKCLAEIFQDETQKVSNELFFKTWIFILGRLEDIKDEVRLLTLDTLKVLLKALNDELKSDPEFPAFMDKIYSTLLIHLDDPKAAIRTKNLDILTTLAEVEQKILTEQFEKSDRKFKHQDGIENLMKQLKVSE